MKNIKIGKKIISLNHSPFLIAEAGINHNGSVRKAKKMIEVAKKSGVDAIKFQTYKSEEIIGDKSQVYTYFLKKKKVQVSMYKMFKKCELSEKSWLILKKKCAKEKIIFLSTPSSTNDLNLLLKIRVPAIKIGSDDFNNIQLIKECSKSNLPLIISCGMSNSKEIDFVLKETGLLRKKSVILMLCVSQYPTPARDVNLSRLLSLKKKYPNLILGFSDHTIGSIASTTAVAYGARCFEKHFTLNKSDKGPDHWFSESPESLKQWADSLKTSYLTIGSPMLKSTKKEMNMKKIARKSIVASRNINRGESIDKKKISLKRPGDGIPPIHLNKIIGMRTTKLISKNEQLNLKFLKY